MYLMNAAAAAAAAGGAHHVLLRHQQQQQQLRQRLDARDGECVMIMAGNGGVKVCEFVDMFCAHRAPNRGRVEEINKISPHLTPKFPPLVMITVQKMKHRMRF